MPRCLIGQNGHMPLYRYSQSDLEPLVRTSLSAERIRERQDIQRLLLQQIEVINEDFLVIAEEYGLFEDSRRRIDLLALDRKGCLVVIELKRTEDGGHMELQALRYAAMVSTMTLDHLTETFASAKGVDVPEARRTILDWLDEPMEELPNQVKIVLISADFSTEITSTVLWLNENYNTDISCFRIMAYRLEDEILLDLQQIIPLPEAKNFQIQQRQKVAATTAGRVSGRDFTRYTLTIAGEMFENLSKQAAVKTAIQKLHAKGIDASLIRSVTEERRWVAVHPALGEQVEEAFRREYPSRSTNSLWFDLGIADEEAVWVIPRFGGLATETKLDALATVAGPEVSFMWMRSDDVPAAPAY
jgi:Endonuclease NucS